MWNRTSADRATRSPSGRRATVRNHHHDWAISTRIAHTPLVTEQDFITAQTIQATRRNTRQADTDPNENVYLLAGRLRCGLCGRKMDSHRAHARAAYRCRHGHAAAHTRPEDSQRNLYLREDHLLARIAAHLTAAGIADNPDTEHTARLVHELDLTFSADTGGITLLNHNTTARARTPRRRHPPRPARTSAPDTGHEAGRQLLLALSHTTASEADQSDTPTSRSSAATRPAAHPVRHSRQTHNRPTRPAAPQRQRHRPGIHDALRTTRLRDAPQVRGDDPPPHDHPDSHRHEVSTRRAGRRPLLLPPHPRTTHEQGATSKLDAMPETRNPTTQPS
ncbi:hypothetical protein GCM10010492_70320 [Saccharothrix mutabilis subsp. mutabilis]|uniref:Recombinase zinc beta ribbon domain-containing protein n=1 Tax=Saccharothrix mutabilis subsp. mutabilis TaxID=66855 RepID=A0ABN0URJ6_9PSEU